MCTRRRCATLGYRERVISSWEWALDRFERAGRMATTIFYGRFPRDVYAYACDSLPLTLFALRAADCDYLIDRHRELFRREVARFHEIVFDPELGMARTSGYFSGPRDCMTGRSTVFANTMIALTAQLIDGDKRIPNPFAGHDVRDHRDAATPLDRRVFPGLQLCRELPSGDGNVWPFFFGVFDEPDMKRRAFATLEERGHTDPVPLRYFERRLPESELPVPKMFTPNYQGDPSWTQLGAIYLGELGKIDRAKMVEKRARMADFLVERDRNYLELYTRDGKPYVGRGHLYHCDEGMIWAAMFLDLYR